MELVNLENQAADSGIVALELIIEVFQAKILKLLTLWHLERLKEALRIQMIDPWIEAKQI